MARNKLEIANIALSKLGANKINSFIEAIAVGVENEANAINDVYDRVLDEVLAEHPWTFAQRRVALTTVVPGDVSRTIQDRVYTPVSITGATAADPVVITASDHGLENGYRIKIVGVSGMTELNSNFYRVANKTVDTFELINEDTEEDIDGSSYTAYTSGGQIQLANDGNPLTITGATAADPVVITCASHGLTDGDWVKIIGVAGMTDINDTFFIVADSTTNAFELTDTSGNDIDGSAYSAYTYGGVIIPTYDMPALGDGVSTVVVYYRPSDMIKPTKKSEENAFIGFEDDKIISDVTGLKLRYTYRCTDAQKYFPKFVDALTTRLAAEIAFRITNSISKAQNLIKLYHEVALPSAVSSDSVQGTPDSIQQDEWLDSFEVGVFPATTGETWHAL